MSSTTASRQEFVNWTGVGFMWFSPVILLLYILKYRLFARRIQKNAMVEYVVPKGAITGKKSGIRPGDTHKRLIGAKDPSFDQWDTIGRGNDGNGAPPQANNMISIGDILDSDSDTTLLQWKVRKDGKNGCELYCGPETEHVTQERRMEKTINESGGITEYDSEASNCASFLLGLLVLTIIGGGIAGYILTRAPDLNVLNNTIGNGRR